MTRLVSIDRDDDYVVQLKTERQYTHCKNNQLSDCATINPNVNSVISDLLLHSRLIDCFYSVCFAVRSLIAQHNHRHGLSTLIVSFSVIN